eukprot:12924497-Prorocentrum_lima.AAC.1
MNVKIVVMAATVVQASARQDGQNKEIDAEALVIGILLGLALAILIACMVAYGCWQSRQTK